MKSFPAVADAPAPARVAESMDRASPKAFGRARLGMAVSQGAEGVLENSIV
jgi:hypothetical protein